MLSATEAVQNFATMTFLYLKAVHIVFIVTWFAGLFYMPRLFVYIIEAHEKGEPDRSVLLKQLNMMSSRLWFGITWPSAVITLGMGASLLITQPEWLNQGFMHLKLFLVFLLYLYHFSLHVIYKQLKGGKVKFSSTQMRLWNEVATIFLISIVFTIVLKNMLSVAWGLAGLLVVTLLIVAGIKLYRKYRNEK